MSLINLSGGSDQLHSVRLPPVALTLSTVDAFVNWALGVSEVDMPDVASAIVKARPATNELVRALLSKLNGSPLQTQLVVLSILGDLGSPLAVQPLAEFVLQPLPQDPPGTPDDDRMPGPLVPAMLQAHAVEAIALIGTGEAMAFTSAMASSHASRVVRSAAAEAFLNRFGNSVAARTALAGVLSAEDQRFLYRAHKTRNVDPATYDQQIQAYYQRFPQDLPTNP